MKAQYDKVWYVYKGKTWYIKDKYPSSYTYTTVKNENIKKTLNNLLRKHKLNRILNDC